MSLIDWETIKWVTGLLVAAMIYPLIIFLLNVGKDKPSHGRK